MAPFLKNLPPFKTIYRAVFEILTDQFKNKLFLYKVGLHSDCQNFDITEKMVYKGVHFSGKGAIFWLHPVKRSPQKHLVNAKSFLLFEESSLTKLTVLLYNLNHGIEKHKKSKILSPVKLKAKYAKYKSPLCLMISA